MMLKLLKEEWPIKVIERAFEQLGLLPHIRAETVSLEQFVRLTRMLSSDSSRE
jgi:16S rRNA A1518/A1519 N6-dimethyltransferase RsmA/KsgA/DIM1 with predicted DNA glycosylase/AP lyase activity